MSARLRSADPTVVTAVRSLTALARAAHPLPAAAVTAFAAALAASAGGSRGQVARVTAAVGTGQLAIGWTNDALDADLDAAAGRGSGAHPKPIPAGQVSRTVVAGAALLASAAGVPASLATGRRAGALHLAGLAAGLGYDLGLKGTVASPAPYVAFFGALPAVAALGTGQRPVGRLCAAAGLLGMAAHAANTLKDVDADAATGVRGLPQRLGPARSSAAAALLVVAADTVVITARGLPWPSRALLGASAAVGVLGAVRGGSGAFRAVLAAAALSVGGVVTGSSSLHAP